MNNVLKKTIASAASAAALMMNTAVVEAQEFPVNNAETSNETRLSLYPVLAFGGYYARQNSGNEPRDLNEYNGTEFTGGITFQWDLAKPNLPDPFVRVDGAIEQVVEYDYYWDPEDPTVHNYNYISAGVEAGATWQVPKVMGGDLLRLGVSGQWDPLVYRPEFGDCWWRVEGGMTANMANGLISIDVRRGLAAVPYSLVSLEANLGRIVQVGFNNRRSRRDN